MAWASKADIYERITGRIIEQMETASASGWQKPCIKMGPNILQAVYGATRREYRGVNVLILWDEVLHPVFLKKSNK